MGLLQAAAEPDTQPTLERDHLRVYSERVRFQQQSVSDKTFPGSFH